jgi:hypothetical protein
VATSDPDHDYTWEYDEAGRVTGRTIDVLGLDPLVELASKYNLAGGRTELAATIGAAVGFLNDYTFDELGRMTV